MKQRLFKNEKGQAMVEFAIVLPFLLMILCGILDFGWIYYNKYKIEDASYQGARFAFVAESNQRINNPTTPINVGQLVTDTKNYVNNKYSSHATVSVDVGETEVSVTVQDNIKCLTFVGRTLFGENYKATSTSVASK